jgi:hypothetical protein
MVTYVDEWEGLFASSVEGFSAHWSGEEGRDLFLGQSRTLWKNREVWLGI